MIRYLFFILVITGNYTCNRPSSAPVISSKIIVISPEGKDSAIQINSLSEVKALLLREMEVHKLDEAYDHFMMLQDTIGGYDYRAEIVLGKIFNSSSRSAVLSWPTSDTTQSMEVYDLKSDSMHPLLSITDMADEQAGISSRTPFIHLQDYNFDGWQDLEIEIAHWDGIDSGFKSKLWLVHAGVFTPVLHFEEINSPQLDSTNRQICSYESGGCADMAMHFSIWQLQADSVNTIRDIDVDCCVGKNGNCLLTINNGKAISVSGNKVYLYVPKPYRKFTKWKLQQ